MLVCHNQMRFVWTKVGSSPATGDHSLCDSEMTNFSFRRIWASVRKRGCCSDDVDVESLLSATHRSYGTIEPLDSITEVDSIIESHPGRSPVVSVLELETPSEHEYIEGRAEVAQGKRPESTQKGTQTSNKQEVAGDGPGPSEPAMVLPKDGSSSANLKMPPRDGEGSKGGPVSRVIGNDDPKPKFSESVWPIEDWTSDVANATRKSVKANIFGVYEDSDDEDDDYTVTTGMIDEANERLSDVSSDVVPPRGGFDGVAGRNGPIVPPENVPVGNDPDGPMGGARPRRRGRVINQAWRKLVGEMTVDGSFNWFGVVDQTSAGQLTGWIRGIFGRRAKLLSLQQVRVGKSGLDIQRSWQDARTRPADPQSPEKSRGDDMDHDWVAFVSVRGEPFRVSVRLLSRLIGFMAFRPRNRGTLLLLRSKAAQYSKEMNMSAEQLAWVLHGTIALALLVPKVEKNALDSIGELGASTVRYSERLKDGLVRVSGIYERVHELVGRMWRWWWLVPVAVGCAAVPETVWASWAWAAVNGLTQLGISYATQEAIVLGFTSFIHGALSFMFSWQMGLFYALYATWLLAQPKGELRLPAST